MKILILAILFVLLLKRVKDTPKYVSKKVWCKEILEWTEKLKTPSYRCEINDMVMLLTIGTFLITQLLLIALCVYIGCLINNTVIIILSALKVSSCLITVWLDMSEFKSVLSCNIEDYKFHRVASLFSVIVDYAYYPLAIYMLIIM